jgi:1-deoxy-D-xylulose-5-phosphate reductoisomerase
MAGAVKNVAVLGATGSIGTSTLDVISRHPDKFRASALSANTKVDELVALCVLHKPDVAVIAETSAYTALKDGLRNAGLRTEAQAGHEALIALASAPEHDTILAAIVGAAGVKSTLAAAHAGKRLLLANKESVVVAGELLMQAARLHNAEILPIDSEHNAIYQCLPSHSNHIAVRRLLLTASGGPFRGRSRESLKNISPEQACAHPNWVMGRKISVDSASLMNKGLEVIEAHHLFSMPVEKIEVVVHPQSVIHSMVDYMDGSVLAQLGNPDMRTAIAYGLAWPERIDSGVAPLDLTQLARFDFEKPDLNVFPCLQLAFDALKIGGTAPAILNAANEIAVEAFLQRKLAFLDIPNVIEKTLSAIAAEPARHLDVLIAADQQGRAIAMECVNKMVMT